MRGPLSCRQIKAICREGEPRCGCGGREFARSFVRFPMTAVARCEACGHEDRCELKRPAPAPKPKPYNPYGY